MKAVEQQSPRSEGVSGHFRLSVKPSESAWQSRGQGFESPQLHRRETLQLQRLRGFFHGGVGARHPSLGGVGKYSRSPRLPGWEARGDPHPSAFSEGFRWTLRATYAHPATLLPIPPMEVDVNPQTAQALKSLGIFVLVLVVMKFFFGWNISIIGSVVLTIILSVVMSLANRR